MYIRDEWKVVPSQLHFARLRCFQNRFQEPYVMIRYLPTTPLFDERFVDYGCNKVQYIDNLRNQGNCFNGRLISRVSILHFNTVLCYGYCPSWVWNSDYLSHLVRIFEHVISTQFMMERSHLCNLHAMNTWLDWIAYTKILQM